MALLKKGGATTLDAPAPKKSYEDELSDLTVQQLLEMRSEIDKRLPATLLRDLNLENELVIQYQAIKELQTSILSDDDIPPNQRAQVANSCGTVLQSLAKMQAEQYTSERFKNIEMLLIKLLNTFPREMTERFFAEYEKLTF